MRMIHRRLFSCLIVIGLTAAMLAGLANITERKDSREKFQEFYEQQQNFDILLLGTSHVLNGLSPMDMWEQNGFAAYNLGVAGCRIASSYWILENALQYTTPKLVVLDCAYLMDAKTHQNSNYMHTIFDTMPLGPKKVEALLDLYEQKKDIVRFLFPFSIYHNRWGELTNNDFFYTPAYGNMGLIASCDVVSAILPEFSASAVDSIDNISTEYLFKIITLCKQRNIDLLLTFLPFNLSQESINDAAYIRQIADQNGLNYLGPGEWLPYIDVSTDFMNNEDDNSHLNLSGMHKASFFLSTYISENYAVPDRRQDPMYHDWHQYYSLYRSHNASLLAGQHSLNNYLVGMADKNYTCSIFVRDPSLLQDELTVNLINNLHMTSIKIEASDAYLLTQSSENARMDVRLDENGIPTLLLNGQPQHCWETSVTDADIFILVTDKDCGSVLNSAAFSLATLERIF